ncbi:MAG: CDP-2,3-bis-(O-geranylgeranyl)-sn-glycerol synthase [Candidatus Thermoplasmatota archaeon]
MDVTTILIQTFWIIIPVYVANASAVLVGGGTPVDFHKIWRDGKRILGDGKTWRGLLLGTFLGMIVGFALSIAAFYINQTEYSYLHLTDFSAFPLMIPILFSLCFGALLGDIVESFFKRRLGKERGSDWIPFDQLDFILGALTLCFILSSILAITGVTKENWFTSNLTVGHIVILLVVTPFIHITANALNKKIRTSKK